MLKLGGIISSFPLLVLRVLSKLIPDNVNKSLNICNVFLEKGFKVRPYDQSGTLVAVLMLSSFKAKEVIEI